MAGELFVREALESALSSAACHELAVPSTCAEPFPSASGHPHPLTFHPKPLLFPGKQSCRARRDSVGATSLAEPRRRDSVGASSLAEPVGTDPATKHIHIEHVRVRHAVGADAVARPPACGPCLR